MAATSASSMATLLSTTSSTREPVNRRITTCRSSKQNADQVEPARNMNGHGGTTLLPMTKSTEPPPFWDVLLSNTKMVLAAYKAKLIRPYDKIRRPDIMLDPFDGKMVKGGLRFRQSFPVRSYEIGTDSRATIEAIMSYLQEAKLNHWRAVGLAHGFGSTPEMAKRNLVLVSRKMHVVVDDYPLWNDVIEVDTWTFPLGRDGQRREWLVRDLKTGKLMVKATSVFVLMDKTTRRLPKFLETMRREWEAHAMKGDPIIDIKDRKPRRLDAERADLVRTGLTPRWNDLDGNYHVNNTKYVNWILEVIPQSILESHELHGVNIEYRRECGKDGSLHSLLAEVRDDRPGHGEANGGIEYDHLLLLEDGAEIARAWTKWRPRQSRTARG